MGCGCWLVLVVNVWAMQMLSGPFVAHSAEPPSYQLLRYEERYTYLRDPAQRSDFFDPIKYIPLSSDREVDLSFGGQVRLRHSYTHNPTWGDDPQIDTGQFLQRYVAHGDLHLGQKARIFAQLLSCRPQLLYLPAVKGLPRQRPYDGMAYITLDIGPQSRHNRAETSGRFRGNPS